MQIRRLAEFVARETREFSDGVVRFSEGLGAPSLLVFVDGEVVVCVG